MSLSELPEHEFARASSLPDACRTLAARAAAKQETVLLAGGTDWIVERHLAPASPAPRPLPLVLDISRLGELRAIAVEGDAARIGSAATYLEIRRHPVLSARVPLLAAMARDVGAIQIQARGTLGGNLATASPAADGVAALAALDATIHLASAIGERAVPLSAFYTGYKKSVRRADEIIVSVSFVLPKEGAAWVWRKVGTRLAQAISKVALAGVAETAGGCLKRLGLGMASVAPTTAFLPTVRALMLSKPPATLTAKDLDAATDADISPIDDIRSTAAYRRHVARALVGNFAAQLART